MKLEQLRKQSDQQLAELLSSQRAELSQLLVDMSTTEVKQVHRVRVLKKSIARVLGLQQERRLDARGQEAG